MENTSERPSYVARFFVVVLGSLVVTIISDPLIELVTRGFVTPGTEVARWTAPARAPVLSDFGSAVETAFIADWVVWFAAGWGFVGLGGQLRRELRQRGAARLWVNPFRHALCPANAGLVAIPFSYYVVFALVVIFKGGRLPDSSLEFAGGILVSLGACALAICGLFVVAVRFWPTSWLPKTKEDGHMTTLNLR